MKLQEIARCVEVLDEVSELLPEDVLDEEKRKHLHKIHQVLEALSRLRI